MILLLTNHGHSDERFNEYVQRASQFYAEQLFHKQLLRHIVVTIKFNKHLDAFGYTSVEKRNSKGKAREFLIELHPYISGVEILKTLAHEFVHVKQYVEEELNEEQTEWNGQAIDSDAMDYYSLPWEVQAFGLEVGLFTNFAKKETLWNIFEGVRNPDTDVEPEPIGWLNEDKLSKTKRPTVAAVSERQDTGAVSKPNRKRREEHVDGRTGRGHSIIPGWLAKLLLQR